MTDFCDTCKYLKEQLSHNQAIYNRMQQSGSAVEVEMRAMESAKADLEEELRQYKSTATKAREFYKASTDRCKQQWEKSCNLLGKVYYQEVRRTSWRVPSIATPTPSVLTTNSQSSGSTYYLQKVSHDIFGIVDHSIKKSTVYNLCMLI